MRIAVLQYPGGHGEQELEYVLNAIFQLDARVLWHTDPEISSMDLVFLGGGFPCIENNTSFNCNGASQLADRLNDVAARGKVIVGLGNGFQFLCEAGLLSGKLERNISGRFICKQVYLKSDNNSTAFTRAIDEEQAFRMPIATYFGRYTADEEVLMEMRQSEQIIFRFSDYEGRITEAVNYSGSRDNIAGICNSAMNVFGIIARPERYVAEVGSDPGSSDILGSFLKEISN